MSIDALSWAFNMTLPSPATKLTLLALANYANDDGEAYPSYKTLCKKTCLSERAIRNHLATLEKLGVLTKQARTRENGSSTSNILKLHIGVDPVDQTKITPEEEVDPPAPRAAPPRHGVPPPPAPRAAPDPSLITVTKEVKHTEEDSRTENVCGIPVKPGLAGACCKAMIQNGVQGCNPSHPTLIALIDAGATEHEFAQAAKTAVSKGKPNFAYAIGIVKGQREEAANLVLHRGRMPNKQELLEQEKKDSTERAKARLFGSHTEKDVSE